MYELVMDLKTLLKSPKRDYLISNDGSEVSVDKLIGKVVCLYFASETYTTDSPCREFTGILRSIYNELKSQDNNCLEVVFVSRDTYYEAFDASFKEMPWLGIPYPDNASRNMLIREFNVKTLPRLVIFDKYGHVWNEDAHELVERDRKQVFSTVMMEKEMNLRSIFGSESINFLKHTHQEVKINDIKEKYIGLFFSTQSSRRARSFTRRLSTVYKQLQTNGENFEIIFISTDQDKESFSSYVANMPWLALPYEEQRVKSQLISRFHVEEVPYLIVVDSAGHVITKEGYSLIMEHGAEAFPFTKGHIAALRELHRDSNSDSPGDSEHIHRGPHCPHGDGTHIWIINNPVYQCAICKRTGSGLGYICNECSSSFHPECVAGNMGIQGEQGMGFQGDSLGFMERPQRPRSYYNDGYYNRGNTRGGGWLSNLIDSDTKKTIIGSIMAGLLSIVVGICSFKFGSK